MPANLARHTLLHIAGATAVRLEWPIRLHALGIAELKPAAPL